MNIRLSAIFFALVLCAAATSAQTTEFSYQGKLNDGANPANASYDFEFRLYDAASGGTQIGQPLLRTVAVAGGIFSVNLDFGPGFPGADRFLEIAVKPVGGGGFTTLTPRQRITSTPYSVKSLSADSATTAGNATQLGGVPAARFVQSDAQGNVSIGGNLNVTGTLTQPIVNVTTEYQIGGQRAFSAPGSFNTFAGLNTGMVNTGALNSFFGYDAGRNNVNASFNSFYGAFAGQGNTTGHGNSFFGDGAGFGNINGANNTFVGRIAGFNNTSGIENSFVGRDAGRNNTTGGRNSFFGAFTGGNCPALAQGQTCPNPLTGNENSFFGWGAGFTHTTGAFSSFFGSSAGQNNTTGFSNSFFGTSAGRNNTTGNQNSIFGTNAGGNCFLVSPCPNPLTGSDNSFFGYESGLNNTSGNLNSFFGTASGKANTIGTQNSFFGGAAGLSNTEGIENSFFGRNAGRLNTTGNLNSFFGRSAGLNNDSGVNNAFFGSAAGDTNTIGSSNTVIGANADVGANNLTFATAIGAGAVVNVGNSVVLGRGPDTVRIPGNLNLTGTFTGNVPASNITGVLPLANGGTGLASPGGSGNFLRSNGTSWTSSSIQAADIPSLNASYIRNSVFPQASADFNVSGSGSATVLNAVTQYNLNGARILSGTGTSLFLGITAGAANQGTENTFLGREAGEANTDGARNTFVGAFAGEANTTADFNTFVGNQAGRMSNGSGNSFFGAFAGAANQSGGGNAFFGISAGGALLSGNSNTFIGQLTGQGMTSGASNTFVGSSAGGGPSNSASFNTFVGQSAGLANTSGGSNVFVGYLAGRNSAEGSGNVIMGVQAGLQTTTGDRNVFLGNDAGRNNVGGSGNTAIGDRTGIGAPGLTNATAIGQLAEVGASNAIVLGSISGVNNATNNTNVGIGTTTPATRLQVVGGSDAEPTGGGYIVLGPTNSAVTPNIVIDNNEIMARLNGVVTTLALNAEGGDVNLIQGGTGNVGIGTSDPLDKLDVDGNIRVGTSGTNGCLKNNDGGTITGTCSSDARFKRGITGFPSVLNNVSKLRPVHYFWRREEFADKEFGPNQTYGLVAQEVEKVLPELVSTDSQGFKQVDYGKLPLLTIQAVKELKAQNEVQQAQIERQQRTIDEMRKMLCRKRSNAAICKGVEQ